MSTMIEKERAQEQQEPTWLAWICKTSDHVPVAITTEGAGADEVPWGKGTREIVGEFPTQKEAWKALEIVLVARGQSYVRAEMLKCRTGSQDHWHFAMLG
jgi:hypothetical protein